MNQLSQNQMYGGGQMMGGQMMGGQMVNPQTLQRIHQNSIFNGSSQPETALGFGQGSMMSSVGGQMPNFGGQSQNFGTSQMMGGQNFGMQQGGQVVTPQALQRIHQNSIFQGKSQPESPEVQRIHQNSIFAGHSQFDGTNTMQAGFGGSMGTMGAGQLPNFGGQQNQGAGQMMGGQGMQMQGGAQVVTPQAIQRIHDQSIFQGKSQLDYPELQRIHQNSIFNGHSEFDGTNTMQGMSGMGGSMTAGQLPNFGGQQNRSSQMMGGQNMQMQGGAQVVTPQALQRIHDMSIFQGKSQLDYPEIQRIHQNSIFAGHSQFDGTNTMQAGFGGTMGAGQMSNYGGGFMAGQLPNFGGQQNRGSSQMMGGQGQQQMVNTAALNAVLNADAGIQDNQGPSSYPASMYTGGNQYNRVNQAVLQEMANMGPQSNYQTFGAF